MRSWLDLVIDSGLLGLSRAAGQRAGVVASPPNHRRCRLALDCSTYCSRYAGLGCSRHGLLLALSLLALCRGHVSLLALCRGHVSLLALSLLALCRGQRG